MLCYNELKLIRNYDFYSNYFPNFFLLQLSLLIIIIRFFIIKFIKAYVTLILVLLFWVIDFMALLLVKYLPNLVQDVINLQAIPYQT